MGHYYKIITGDTRSLDYMGGSQNMWALYWGYEWGLCRGSIGVIQGLCRV